MRKLLICACVCVSSRLTVYRVVHVRSTFAIPNAISMRYRFFLSCSLYLSLQLQFPRANSGRQGTDERLRCLAAQAAAAAMSKANESVNPIGIPEVRDVKYSFHLSSLGAVLMTFFFPYFCACKFYNARYAVSSSKRPRHVV